jgi:hypothetical protein
MMIEVQKNLQAIKRMKNRENLKQSPHPPNAQSFLKMALHKMVLKAFAMST